MEVVIWKKIQQDDDDEVGNKEVENWKMIFPQFRGCIFVRYPFEDYWGNRKLFKWKNKIPDSDNKLIVPEGSVVLILRNWIDLTGCERKRRSKWSAANKWWNPVG